MVGREDVVEAVLLGRVPKAARRQPALVAGQGVADNQVVGDGADGIRVDGDARAGAVHRVVEDEVAAGGLLDEDALLPPPGRRSRSGDGCVIATSSFIHARCVLVIRARYVLAAVLAA